MSTADYTAPVLPAAPGSLRGVARVSANNISSNQFTLTYRAASEPGPVREYEVCFTCHSSWTTRPAGQSDFAAKFNDKNPSFHPVEGAGKNLNINAAAWTNGWKETSLVYCTDCHTSDDTTIRGPHGSNNRWILKRPYTNANSPALASNGLCFDCHSYAVYASTSTSTVGSRWRGISDRPGHTHGGYSCYACHDSHGSSTTPFLLGHSVSVYTKTATGGSCDPSCHGAESYSVAYPR
jgi:hypothetical protein